jgi:protein-tyrosine-phosphatase
MAEAVMKEKIRKAGLENKIFVDSSGTADYHVGQSPDLRTIKTLKKNGMDTNHTGQQLRTEHLLDFDYVLAMDSENLRHIQALIRQAGKPVKAQIALFKSYRNGAFNPDSKDEIDDPYYGDNGAFQRCYDETEAASEGFLQYLKNNGLV